MSLSRAILRNEQMWSLLKDLIKSDKRLVGRASQAKSATVQQFLAETKATPEQLAQALNELGVPPETVKTMAGIRGRPKSEIPGMSKAGITQLRKAQAAEEAVLGRKVGEGSAREGGLVDQGKTERRFEALGEDRPAATEAEADLMRGTRTSEPTEQEIRQGFVDVDQILSERYSGQRKDAKRKNLRTLRQELQGRRKNAADEGEPALAEREVRGGAVDTMLAREDAPIKAQTAALPEGELRVGGFDDPALQDAAIGAPRYRTRMRPEADYVNESPENPTYTERQDIEFLLGREPNVMAPPERPLIMPSEGKPGAGRIVGQGVELQAYGDAERAIEGMPRFAPEARVPISGVGEPPSPLAPHNRGYDRYYDRPLDIPEAPLPARAAPIMEAPVPVQEDLFSPPRSIYKDPRATGEALDTGWTGGTGEGGIAPRRRYLDSDAPVRTSEGAVETGWTNEGGAGIGGMSYPRRRVVPETADRFMDAPGQMSFLPRDLPEDELAISLDRFATEPSTIRKGVRHAPPRTVSDVPMSLGEGRVAPSTTLDFAPASRSDEWIATEPVRPPVGIGPLSGRSADATGAGIERARMQDYARRELARIMGKDLPMRLGRDVAEGRQQVDPETLDMLIASLQQ